MHRDFSSASHSTKSTTEPFPNHSMSTALESGLFLPRARNESYARFFCDNRVDYIAVHIGVDLGDKLRQDCGQAKLSPATCRDSLCEANYRREIRALVIDPSFGEANTVRSLVDVARNDQIPIVLYCQPTLCNICQLLEILSREVQLAILNPSETAFTHIQRHILGHTASATTYLLCRLARRIRVAPPLMAMTLISLFCNDRLNSVERLANESAVSRRGLYRWLDKLGLCPPHDLLSIVRLSKAYTVLRYTDATVHFAGQVSGYASKQTFTRHCLHITGWLTPSELRNTEEMDFVARLTSALTTTSRDATLQ